MLDGSIPSGVSDTGASSTVGKPGDPFIQTDIPSNKTFYLPDAHTINSTNVAYLEHELREPARTVDMVPELAENTLISTGKFADANYISVYDKKEVNVYDGNTVKIVISEEAALKVNFNSFLLQSTSR